MIIRDEEAKDYAEIHQLIAAAFMPMAHSCGREALIVDELRRTKMLSLSMVAEIDGSIVGHIAFSPLIIDDRQSDWYALGPLAVRQDHQKTGIGSALVQEGLNRIHAMHAAGCALLGAPEYYGRFGFRINNKLTCPGVPPEGFQILSFTEIIPTGTAAFDQAFSVSH